MSYVGEHVHDHEIIEEVRELFFDEGWSHSDIACRTDLTRGQVAGIVYRLRKNRPGLNKKRPKQSPIPEWPWRLSPISTDNSTA